MNFIRNFFFYVIILSTFINTKAKEYPILLKKRPLEIINFNSYFCILKESKDTQLNREGSVYNHSRISFFIPESIRPPIVATDLNSNIICHDVMNFGPEDQLDIPRLGLIENFSLIWGFSDERFKDKNNNGILDINELLTKEYKTWYNKDKEILLFAPLYWPNGPSNLQSPALLGHILRHQEDQQSGTPYCPTTEHFIGSDPLMRLLGRYIETDTQAIYMATKVSEYHKKSIGKLVSATGDFILIDEEKLLNVGLVFNQEGGVSHLNKEDLLKKDIFLYWPIRDEDLPLKKHRGQALYQITHPSLLHRTPLNHKSAVAKDKRLGCIPTN